MIAGVFYQSSPELVVWHLTGLCYRSYGACAVAGSVYVFESEAEKDLFLEDLNKNRKGSTDWKWSEVRLIKVAASTTFTVTPMEDFK